MAISVVEYGLTTGPAILFFHGWPGSRLEAGYLADAATAAGVRLIGLDRPGFGGSERPPKRELVDWPRDVTAWADSAGLDRFGVIGFSGGSPYALACAVAIPDRLITVGVVSGMAPPEALAANPGAQPSAQQLGQALSGAAPWLTSMLWMRTVVKWKRQPEAPFQELLAQLPEADRSVLEPRRRLFIENMQEALRQGPMGLATEAGLFAKPWGFALGDVRAPVRLWHGEADANVPVALARWVSAAVPRCQPVFLDGEAHYSTLITRAEEILRALAS